MGDRQTNRQTDKQTDNRQTDGQMDTGRRNEERVRERELFPQRYHSPGVAADPDSTDESSSSLPPSSTDRAIPNEEEEEERKRLGLQRGRIRLKTMRRRKRSGGREGWGVRGK